MSVYYDKSSRLHTKEWAKKNQGHMLMYVCLDIRNIIKMWIIQ